MGARLVPRKEQRSEMYFDDRWVDISEDIRDESALNITHGAASQDRVVPPAKCTTVLKNNSEQYSRRNPLSPNYGKLKNNLPLRVTNAITRDGFGRTTVNGWGTGDCDDLWLSFQDSGTLADFATSNGVATHVVGTANTRRLSYLPLQLHRNVDVSIEFSCSVVNVTGGELRPANIVLRGQDTSNHLLMRVSVSTGELFRFEVFDQNGTVYGSGPVVLGPTYSANTWYKVRANAEGGTLRGKLWVVDSTVDGSDGEPLDWDIEVTVPFGVKGWVGVRSSLETGNTNTPVTFSYRKFEVRSSRFIGESSVMSPRWNVAETLRTASLEASGISRRLGQGSPVLKSTLRRGIPTLTNLVQYWPMEDGKDATELASAFPGFPGMSVEGDYDLAAYDGFASSEDIPTLGACIFRGDVPPYTSTGQVQTRWIMHAPDDALAEPMLIHRVWLTGGTLAFWDLYTAGTGGLRLIVSDGTSVVLDSSFGFDIRGLNCRMSLQLAQNGGDIDWGLWLYEVGAGGAGGVTGTLAGEVLGIASQVCFSLNGELSGTAIGHATVEKAVTDIFALSSQLNAYNGETATARLGRLCFEEGVPITLSGEFDPEARMGPQLPDTLPNLLRQCAETEQGILGESRVDLALKYRTRLSMINQLPAVTIDRSKNQLSPPFEPTDDDRLIVNDVTAKRINGSSFRMTQDTGPMGTQNPPVGAGRYETAPEFSAYWDVQLPHLAGWLLALGTVDEYRIPSVVSEMGAPGVDKDPQLVADLLSLDVGDLLVVTGLAPIGIYDDVLQVVRGYSEVMTPRGHKITSNTFPYAPYRALITDDATLGRADSDSSATASGFTATAGSFSVATTNVNELWTTSGAEFPLDVMVGGERITLSGITGASSPQTFTVAANGRGVNGVREPGATTGGKAHEAGEPVHVFNVVRLA